MKKRAREESVPLAQIYRQEMTKLYGAPGCEETAVNLPSFQNLKSSLYHSRLQRFPTRAEIDFRGEWTRTAHEEDFLLMDTGQNDQNCLVAFAIVGNLEKLYEAETIYIYRRNFQGQPMVVLSALHSTYAVYSGQHFPFVYALLPNKTTLTYNRFFAKLKESCLENGLHLNPSVILSDFEGGIISSIALQFPGAHHQGCFYHFSPAIWKAVKNHGLQSEYTSNNELRFFIRQLMAFLQEWEIFIYYAELKQQKPSKLPQLDSLLSYFENTWLGSFLLQCGVSLSRMETEQIITWRGGTGSSMQSSVDHIPTSINWLMSSKESKPKLILQLSNLMLDHSHPGERENTWL